MDIALAAKWLRKFTSNLDFGTKYKNCPIHCNTNVETVNFLNGNKKFLDSMRNKDFSAHFNNEKTFYFTGNNRGAALVMIDIDCHESGSLNGAMSYAKAIRQFFPNLYYEASTNGKGGHAYFILEDQDKNSLKRLATALNNYSKPFDVEFVEIKGLAPVVTWKNRIASYIAGTLAKIPREYKRFNEWEQTTRLDVVSLLDTIDKIEATLPVIPTIIKIPQKYGSVIGKHIKLDMLPAYIQFSKSLTPQNLKTSGRTIVTHECLAYGLYILEFLTTHMNPDGSMPHKRIETLWKKCYEAGDFKIQWDNKRWATIRNFLSSIGVIDWTDHTYSHNQAAKWQLNKTFIIELKEIKNIEASFTGTRIIRTQNPTYTRPEFGIPSMNRLQNLLILEQEVKLLMKMAA
jgi:hypothetical protein